MTDGRDFQWSGEAEARVEDVIDDGVYEERYYGGIASEILVYLLPIVREALAAEYDRGYEAALDMEQEPLKEAWDDGFRAGQNYSDSVAAVEQDEHAEVEETYNPYA